MENTQAITHSDSKGHIQVKETLLLPASHPIEALYGHEVIGACLAVLGYACVWHYHLYSGNSWRCLIPTGSPPAIFSCLQTLLHHSPEQFLYVVLDRPPLSTLLIPALCREGSGLPRLSPQPVASGGGTGSAKGGKN